MPVLILAIASFLLFVGITALLLIAGRLESRTIKEKTLRVTAARPTLSIAEAFDPIL